MSFRDDFEAAHYAAVVKANPRREGEDQVLYIRRIAILAGGVEPEEVEVEHLRKIGTPGFEKAPESRLPYKD